ncbi:hypothetical protein UT300012_24090 [Paraclostridium bifermentans]
MGLDNVKLNIILVLDDVSRKKMKVHLGDLGFKGVEVITSLQEITKDMLIRTKKVVLLEGFAQSDNSLSELSLYKEVHRLEYIYLGCDKTSLAMMRQIAECYKIDITYLKYEELHAVILEDVDTIEKLTKDDKELIDEYEKVANKILRNTTITDSSREVSDACLHLIDMVKSLSDELDIWKAKAERAIDVVQTQEETVDRVLRAHANMLERAKETDRNLEQYEMILSKNVYTKISLQNYENPPIVIYFKNYQELIHMESFILTLYNMIKGQLRLSCKVLRLYDNSASQLVKPTKNKYKMLLNKFTVDDVYDNDFILKYGDYTKVLDLIFSNELNLDILLIFDFKDKDDIVTLGQSATYNMCRYEGNIDAFNITNNNTIVNNSFTDRALSWDTYEEYFELPNTEERFLYLSNKPVMQEISKAIEISAGVM